MISTNTEAAARGVLLKKVFLKILQNFTEKEPVNTLLQLY